MNRTTPATAIQATTPTPNRHPCAHPPQAEAPHAGPTAAKQRGTTRMARTAFYHLHCGAALRAFAPTHGILTFIAVKTRRNRQREHTLLFLYRLLAILLTRRRRDGMSYVARGAYFCQDFVLVSAKYRGVTVFIAAVVGCARMC